MAANEFELLMPGDDGRIAEGPTMRERGEVACWIEPVGLGHIPAVGEEAVFESDFQIIYENRAYLCVFGFGVDGRQYTKRFYVPAWLTEVIGSERRPTPYAMQLAEERFIRRWGL